MNARPLAGGLAAAPIVYIVEEQANPSTDLYVQPALAGGNRRIVRCGFSDIPAPQEIEGAVVVFVRYVPPVWAKFVHEARARLGGVVYFMDDDVLDVSASADTPWHYRLKLLRFAAGRLKWLRSHRAEFWVSTRYLQNKYAALQPRLVLPAPQDRATGIRRVFYHGTASHESEIRWLRPVIEEVMRRDERVAFEIIGGQAHHRLYRDLPRVTVVHQMKWPAYRAFLDLSGRHIGLAPLLDRPFNHGRSYTKFFDITRAGAAGIYAQNSACGRVVTQGVDGLVANNDEEAWVAAILELAGDETLRQRILKNAEAKVRELSETARVGYRRLTEPRPASKKKA